MPDSVNEICVPSLRLSIGRRSVGRGENMLDPEDMRQNTEGFTGEVGTVVAQENQSNSVVAYPAINENLGACICRLVRYGNCNRDLRESITHNHAEPISAFRLWQGI
jgi:hypothetical protein